MQYIVLDLEWNQPVSYQCSAYRKVGDRLLFEVIQFGAVKLDENLEIVDTISIPVHPTHYLTIHPRVKRMTGLSQEVLCDAPDFPEGFEQFMDHYESNGWMVGKNKMKDWQAAVRTWERSRNQSKKQQVDLSYLDDFGKGE